MVAPQFSYAFQPARAVSGMISDINLASVDSYVLSDALGTSSGKVMSAVPQGFPGTGVKVGQRIRALTTRPVVGFVVYNPGKPGDPATEEYENYSLVPVCVQGRQWVYCENFAVDPLLATDTWFVRDTSGVGDSIRGNLRYGTNDGGACTRIPQGHIRVIDAITLSGGAALVHLDFNFRDPAAVGATGATGQGFTYRGVYSGATAYVPYDVVRENAGTAPGTYVCIAAVTGELPSTHVLTWAIVALDGA